MSDVVTLPFDAKAVKRWRRDVWRAFEREGYRGPAISAAMVLVAVAVAGTDLLVLTTLTGLSRDYVRKVLMRLRKEGVVRGRTIRAAWMNSDDGFAQSVAVLLDAGVAAGDLSRFVDAERSAAQKARAPETRVRRRQTRRPVEPGTVFQPQVTNSNPLYGLPEWKARNETKA